MNDFTNTELKSLRKWGEIYRELGYSWNDNLDRPLISKIKSMIENYKDEHKDDRD